MRKKSVYGHSYKRIRGAQCIYQENLLFRLSRRLKDYSHQPFDWFDDSDSSSSSIEVTCPNYSQVKSAPNCSDILDKFPVPSISCSFNRDGNYFFVFCIVLEATQTDHVLYDALRSCSSPPTQYYVCYPTIAKPYTSDLKGVCLFVFSYNERITF